MILLLLLVTSMLFTLKSLVDSFDVCFLQEHWLTSNHFHRITEFSTDFLSVGVSGIDDSVWLSGRPYAVVVQLSIEHLCLLALHLSVQTQIDFVL